MTPATGKPVFDITRLKRADGTGVSIARKASSGSDKTGSRRHLSGAEAAANTPINNFPPCRSA